MPDLPCGFCGGPIPLEWERCPHCARPGLFPNVREASLDPKPAEVEQRYQAARRKLIAGGIEPEACAFETAVARSKAVIARPLRDTARIISSDRELFATFYGLTEGEVRLADDDKWARLRGAADQKLFGQYGKHIRFAALTLDGIGLSRFGDCFLVLREDMIAHRASVFEDNSAALMARHLEEPAGCRATWEERAKLCLAKHEEDLRPGIERENFPRILLREEPRREDSRFVEVHIWGPLSIRSCEDILPKETVPNQPQDESTKAFRMEIEEIRRRMQR